MQFKGPTLAEALHEAVLWAAEIDEDVTTVVGSQVTYDHGEPGDEETVYLYLTFQGCTLEGCCV